jgi:hypothetical protein
MWPCGALASWPPAPAASSGCSRRPRLAACDRPGPAAAAKATDPDGLGCLNDPGQGGARSPAGLAGPACLVEGAGRELEPGVPAPSLSWSAQPGVDPPGSLEPLEAGSLRTHPFAPDARARPGKTPVRTALSPRYLIRMRSLVQASQAHYTGIDLRKRLSGGLVQWRLLPSIACAQRSKNASLPGGCTVALRRIPVRIQAVRGSAVLNHSCAVSLTSGVPRHSLPCGFVCLRPSHLGRTQWPSTTIAAMTAAVSSSGCRWARPRRLSRARAAVGTPGGSSPCR